MKNNEENKIQEAQVSESEKTDEAVSHNASEQKPVPKKKINKDLFVELILFFILGILIGIAVKTEAIKNITIGFDDYKMKVEKQDYDIDKLQQDLAASQLSQQEKRESNPSERGGDNIDNQ